MRGVDGLRVADASTMPNVIGGNTNAPCIMIGERCAELMQRTQPAKPVTRREAAMATPA